MSKIIADRMNVGDDELHFRDDDAQKKLKDLIVQEKGNSKTAVMSQEAATVEFDKLSEDIDYFSITTNLCTASDFSVSSATGWVAGYYDFETTLYAPHDHFIRTERLIPTNGNDRVTITPPSGCAVAIVVCNKDNTISQTGHANTNTFPENADVTVCADLTNAVAFGVSVGRFRTNNSAELSNNVEYCNSIVFKFEKSCKSSAECGKTVYDALYTKKFNWMELATEDAPYGWKDGYYALDGTIVDGTNNFIRTPYIPLDNVKEVKVAPPFGYAVAITALKPDGTFVTVGQGNSASNPQNINRPFVLNADGYDRISLSIGNFNGSSPEFLTNAEFINSIEMEFIYKDAQLENGDVDNSNSEIAPYFETEAVKTVESVRELLTEPCLVFPLITDIHYKSNTEKPNLFDETIENMKRVLSDVSCDFVLNLGDNTDGDTSQAITLERADYMNNRFRELGLPYYCAIGNHDTNYYNGDLFSLAQMYRGYISSTKDAVFNRTNLGTDCYKDFDSLGVRLVVLNANHGRYAFTADTATWLSETALKTSNIVILAVHLSPIETQNWNYSAIENMDAVKNALQSFVSDGGTLIQLCGHCHADYAFINPWLTVFSTCGKFESVDTTVPAFTAITGYVGELVAPSRNLGTATEDAWSVVVVRPQARKINFVRFGAGEDREFSF